MPLELVKDPEVVADVNALIERIRKRLKGKSHRITKKFYHQGALITVHAKDFYSLVGFRAPTRAEILSLCTTVNDVCGPFKHYWRRHSTSTSRKKQRPIHHLQLQLGFKKKMRMVALPEVYATADGKCHVGHLRQTLHRKQLENGPHGGDDMYLAKGEYVDWARAEFDACVGVPAAFNDCVVWRKGGLLLFDYYMNPDAPARTVVPERSQTPLHQCALVVPVIAQGFASARRRMYERIYTPQHVQTAMNERRTARVHMTPPLRLWTPDKKQPFRQRPTSPELAGFWYRVAIPTKLVKLLKQGLTEVDWRPTQTLAEDQYAH